jgi:hypothetical protein
MCRQKARKTSKHVDEHATAAEERAVKRPKRSSAKKTVEVHLFKYHIVDGC